MVVDAGDKAAEAEDVGARSEALEHVMAHAPTMVNAPMMANAPSSRFSMRTVSRSGMVPSAFGIRLM